MLKRVSDASRTPKAYKAPQNKGLLEAALEILRDAVNGRPFANQAQLARASGESEPNISRWINGTSTPTLRKLEPVLMTLGVTLTLPHGQQITTGGHKPGRLKHFDLHVSSWHILKDESRLPSTLVLKMPDNDNTMQPTINAGDLAVINTTQKYPAKNGVFLIKYTSRDTVYYAFRRIFLNKNGQKELFFVCCDNVKAECSPEMYHAGIANIIIGSVNKIIRNI